MNTQYIVRLTKEEHSLFKQMILHELDCAERLADKVPDWGAAKSIPMLKLLLDKIEHAEVRMK